MYADIEALVLSGELFNGPERSSSPTRSISPSSEESDPGWHDDMLNASESSLIGGKAPSQQQPQQESIGMGPGRTGVKGVIRDRDEAVGMERAKQEKDVEALRARMEKGDLGGKTYLEEEREKYRAGASEGVDPLVLRETERERERRDVFGHAREGKFGHLREVGVSGYLGAVENEDKGVWVVVHLYEPSVDRCYTLDDSLTHLARIYPDTKFLRCRASALGFTSSAPRTSTSTISRSHRTIHEDDEDDPYGDGHDDEEEDDLDEDTVDLDMLPTMLVYRSGELVHNWVRVDWEAGRGGIEELLDKHNILPRKDSVFGNLGLPSDDEEEELDEAFLWGDSDDDS